MATARGLLVRRQGSELTGYPVNRLHYRRFGRLSERYERENPQTQNLAAATHVDSMEMDRWPRRQTAADFARRGSGCSGYPRHGVRQHSCPDRSYSGCLFGRAGQGSAVASFMVERVGRPMASAPALRRLGFSQTEPMACQFACLFWPPSRMPGAGPLVPSMPTAASRP